MKASVTEGKLLQHRQLCKVGLHVYRALYVMVYFFQEKLGETQCYHTQVETIVMKSNYKYKYE